MYGQRRIFLSGAALFTLASSVGGLGSNSVTLVVARAFQGLGAAIMTPATRTVLGRTFTQPGSRAKAFGAWSVVSGAAGAVGVILGGVVTEWTSWRWTLLINVPLGLVLLAGVYLFVPERAGHSGPRKLDVPGAFLVTLGLLGCVFGIAESRAYGWVSAPVLAALIAGLGLLCAFLAYQATIAKHPLVPLGFFRNRAVSAANLVAFFSIALGSGLLNTTRQLGSATGLVVLVALATSTEPLAAGYRLALVGAAMFTALGMLATLAVPVNRRPSAA